MLSSWAGVLCKQRASTMDKPFMIDGIANIAAHIHRLRIKSLHEVDVLNGVISEL
jgi:hypothetical protein